MKNIITVILLSLLIPGMSFGADEHNHDGDKKTVAVEALSPDLRILLSREMQALQSGMMAIIPAYISGNWGEIESIAGKMKRSYILKQSLTDAQIKEMHTILPSGFIEKDQRFHYLAGMLEHAAKAEKPELINFYFSEMTRSCASCHSTFATHKFPALLPREKDPDHRH
ncbi:MAG: hypothetical protein COB49_12115 [Alphaproteobacteria bacterium]|nr:MAG: hypothetical protein COB49_12115 [Alphaproteobacteria bacterium]